MNFITLYFSILVMGFATFISTNKSLDLRENKQLTKCLKISIKNLKNEELIDSICFSDSLICIELIDETNTKYEIPDIEITSAQDRRFLGLGNKYYNIKSGDTLNIGRSLTKLVNRRKERQKYLSEMTDKDIKIEPINLRIIIELKNAFSWAKFQNQKYKCRTGRYM